VLKFRIFCQLIQVRFLRILCEVRPVCSCSLLFVGRNVWIFRLLGVGIQV